MRFMILRKADPNTEAGALPNQELLAAMGQYMEGMARAASCWPAKASSRPPKAYASSSPGASPP